MPAHRHHHFTYPYIKIRKERGRAEMKEHQPIRILICEDQTLMREGLKTILELDGGEPPFEIIGEAADGEEAVRQARTLSPDVALMDIQMPRQNGVQATAAITTTLPAT